MQTMDVENIFDLITSHQKILQGTRPGKRSGQATFLRLPIQFFEQLLVKLTVTRFE